MVYIHSGDNANSSVSFLSRFVNCNFKIFTSYKMFVLLVFSARCNIYISCLCHDASPSVRLSVRLSVTEVHWRIIANLGFKFRSKFTAHCVRGEG